MVLCCKTQGSMVSTNDWHTWKRLTTHIFRQWWALDHVWARWGTEKATTKRLLHVVACWLQTVCGVLIISLETWKRSASSPYIWLMHSMTDFPVSYSRTWGRSFQGSSQRHRPPYLKFWNQCVQSRHYPQNLTYSTTWFGCEQAYLKVIKQTIPNEQFRNIHIYLPLLELWLKCLRNAPSLVKSNASSHYLTVYPAHDALICLSMVTSSKRLKNDKNVYVYFIDITNVKVFFFFFYT